MAHIFELSAVLDTGYVDGKKVDDRFKFPNTGIFSGINKPFRLEGDIFDLEVEGEIPLEINGTFYRVQPDHRFHQSLKTIFISTVTVILQLSLLETATQTTSNVMLEHIGFWQRLQLEEVCLEDIVIPIQILN